MTIKQFRLTSGCEIMADVVEAGEIDDKEVIVRNAMEIARDKTRYGETVFVFRPWFQYVESSDDLVLVNYNHITAVANPHPYLTSQYIKAVNDMHADAEAKDEEFKRMKIKRFYDIATALAEMKQGNDDSDEPDYYSNVIPFPEP